MHVSERHRLILSAVANRPVATIGELGELIGSSEATIRRDLASLHLEGKLRRVRGGAEAVNPPEQGELMGRPFAVSQSMNMAAKRAIAQAAVALCRDGEPIIINGGTTTYQMVHYLAGHRVSVFTNSFAIAEHLLHNSKNNVVIPGGAVYREQSLILSPFGGGVASHFYARRMFMGCQGLAQQGLMEADPLVVQSELGLIDQANELVVLADSSKFRKQSSLILCGLERITTVITDSALRDEDRLMLEAADVGLIVVEAAAPSAKSPSDT